jgi:hypothetical protein
MKNVHGYFRQDSVQYRSAQSIITLPNYPISTLKRRLVLSAFFFFLLLPFSMYSQRRDTSWLDHGPVRWMLVEKSFGVMTEMDFANGTMGLNICRGRFVRGTQRSMAGTGYYAGMAFDTDHEVAYASFGGFAGLFKKRMGGQVALKGLYYISKREQVFAIRPEAGIGFPKAQLSYGYTFYTAQTEMNLPVHTLTLYVYFGVHSVRTALF